MNSTRLRSFSSSPTTDACEMPIDASWVSDFTMSGNCSRFGSRTLRPRRNDGELGHGDAVVGEELLRERLVAREQQAARVAAGVRHAQQLEVADDVLVEQADVVERLEQVEDDRAASTRRSPARIGVELVLDAEHLHLVAVARAASR